MTDQPTNQPPVPPPGRPVSPDGLYEWDGAAWVPRQLPPPPPPQAPPNPYGIAPSFPVPSYPDPAQPQIGQPYATPQPTNYGDLAGPPYGSSFGQPAYGGGPAPRYPYAGWWRRAGALLIDSVPFISVLIAEDITRAALIDDELFMTPAETRTATTIGLFFLVLYLAAIGFWFWNSVWRQGTTGQSLGKRALGIKLIRIDTGQPTGKLLAFGRGIAQVLNSLTCYIGWLLPLFTARKQTLADLICSTVVIDARQSGPSGPASTP